MKKVAIFKFRVWLVLIVALLSFGAQTTLRGECGKIVFVSSRSGNNDIWIMDDDGSNQVQLTFSPDSELSPSFAPDGCRISYVNYDTKKLMIMNADGTNQHVIYDSPASQIAMTAWSPCGDKIAFRQGPYNYYDLWTINVDGTGLFQVTTDGMHYGIPSWSPDCQWIVHTRRSSAAYSYSVEIWKIKANGTEHTQLTFGGSCGHTCENDCPDLSPDGSKIIYCSGEYGNTAGSSMYPHDLWMMNIDGSDKQRLTTEYTMERYPKWSPDNTRAAFTKYDDIYVKGILETRLTYTGNNGLGDWHTPCSGYLEVTSPNGGESWSSCSTRDITWDCVKITGLLKITLWKDGVLLGLIAKNVNPSTGYYSWEVGQHSGGAAVPGSGYTVKIKEVGTAVFDDSDAPFTIAAPTMTVLSPNGGENWQIGTNQNITWNAECVAGLLKITLWKDGVQVGLIAKNVQPGAGFYSWQAGQYSGGTAVAGTGYTIKIKEVGTVVVDAGDGAFTLSD
ncbi:MAG: PD40 domain-containing protein [Candidatus Aminicenantes bacterium]|nr:PD40 domain-containing protein [Candidatus Aminicenantes bacterium]